MAGSSLDLEPETIFSEPGSVVPLSSRSDLFQLGSFTLHSGQKSFFKIECDSLTAGEISCLARLMLDRVPPFGRVVGVPRGGVRFAAALQPYCRPDCPRVLIVDDIYTTGQSIQRQREKALKEFRCHGDDIVGIVFIAREEIPDSWVTALLQLTPAKHG